MTEKNTIKNSTFETFKKSCKDLISSNDFGSFNEMAMSFRNLSLEEKINALEFIKTLPSSSRKTLIFSAFVKAEKKKISREINQMGYLL